MMHGYPTTRHADPTAAIPASGGEGLFALANLFPEDTGLPMTVWVSPRGHARHAARIKVCQVPGNRMVPEETAVLGILPEPQCLLRLLTHTQWQS